MKTNLNMVANNRPAAGISTLEILSCSHLAHGAETRRYTARQIGIALAFTLVSAAHGAEPGSDLVLKGEQIFQKTAGGGVGCAACHGSDAYGTDRAGNIRGATAEEIAKALQDQPAMGFIKLTADEIRALAAYLDFLKSQ